MCNTELNTDCSQSYLLIPFSLMVERSNHKFERPEIKRKKTSQCSIAGTSISHFLLETSNQENTEIGDPSNRLQHKQWTLCGLFSFFIQSQLEAKQILDLHLIQPGKFRVYPLTAEDQH